MVPISTEFTIRESIPGSLSKHKVCLMDLYQHALNLYTRNNDKESIPVLQKLLSENPTHFAG